MKSEILERRKNLVSNMQANSAAIFFSAPEVVRSNDTCYPYRQNSDFWYLTGFAEPESALLIVKKSEQDFATILFNQQKDPLAETWTGYRLGQSAALNTIVVDEAYPFDDIQQLLPKYISHTKTLYHADQQYDYADQIIYHLLKKLRNGIRENLKAPDSITDWRPIIHELRLFKSSYEIDLIRKATKISTLAHCQAMQICRPNIYEYQLEAEILHQFIKNGASAPAYNTIVGGGNNACILHYDSNQDQLKDGDLVLIDAGCEYQYYAGDITRTFPINGKFTPAQKAIYNIVLTAQYKAIEMLKPGISIKEVNDQVIRLMVSELIKLNIMQGDIEQLIAEKAYTQFYMHGLGHWLGIDVHDVGNYKTTERSRILESNMVLTVEPGLYIDKHATVPEQYKGIGIRIEDNILITQTGNEVLTREVPKEPDLIESLMTKYQHF